MNATETEVKKKPSRAEDVFRIDPRLILINPDNIRDIDPASANNQHLKKTIIKQGVRKVLLLKANPNFGVAGHPHAQYEYICVDGNRRLTMTMEAIADGAPIETVRATIKKKLSDEESLLSMFLDNDSELLNPMQKAKGVIEFIDNYGWTIEKVAEELGESVPTIKRLYAMKQYPFIIQEFIRNEQIAPQVVFELSAKIKDDKELIRVVKDKIASLPVKPIETVIEETPTDENTQPSNTATKPATKAKAKSKATASDFKDVLGEKNAVKKAEALRDKLANGDRIPCVSLDDLILYLKGKLTLEEATEKGWTTEAGDN